MYHLFPFHLIWFDLIWLDFIWPLASLLLSYSRHLIFVLLRTQNAQHTRMTLIVHCMAQQSIHHQIAFLALLHFTSLPCSSFHSISFNPLFYILPLYYLTVCLPVRTYVHRSYLVIYGGASPEEGPMGDTVYALLPSVQNIGKRLCVCVYMYVWVFLRMRVRVCVW